MQNIMGRLLVVLSLVSSPLIGADPASAAASTLAPAKTTSTSSASSAPPSGAKSSSPEKKSDHSEPARMDDVPATITVTAATRHAQTVQTTAASISVVTQQQIEDRHDVQLSDALVSLPGINLINYGGPGQLVSVQTRGTKSDQTLFTIDGRRQAVDSSNLFDFTNITLDNVQQIEYDRTPTSNVQGGNAIGGTVNLVTLNGRGLKEPESSASFEVGSYDTFREAVQSRGNSGAFDYGVAMSRTDADYTRPSFYYDSYSETKSLPLDSTYRNDTYRGNYGYQITPAIYVDMQTSYGHSNAGSPGTITYVSNNSRLIGENYNLSPRITAQVTDFYTTTAYYNYTQFDRQYVFPDPTLGFEPGGYGSQSKTEVLTHSVDWQNDFQVSRHWKVIAGIQGDSSEIDEYSQLDQANPTQGFPGTAGQKTVGNTLSNIGGYVQSQWEAVENLNLLNSVRYDHYSDFEGAWSWRQGVSYQVDPTQTLVHGSVSSSYSTPSVDYLSNPGFYTYDNNGNVIQAGVGNPNLKPVTALGWEIGAEQPFWEQRIKLGATYFHTKEHGPIVSLPPYYDPVNGSKATSDGWEITLKAQPVKQVQGELNYTYLNAVDATNQQVQLQPHHTLNLNIDYTPIDPLTFTLGGNWVFDRNYLTDAGYAYQTEDYATIRASGTWRINKWVSIWARGDNILNEKYSIQKNYPALGASGFAGIKVSF